MIYEVKMFSATCDNCKTDWYDDHNGWCAMSDRNTMREMLHNCEWHIEDGGEIENRKCYCPDCFEYDDDDNFVLKSDKSKPTIVENPGTSQNYSD